MNKFLRPLFFFDANSGGGGGTDEKPEGDKPKGKTFTQEELDDLFAKRAKQASENALKELFKTVGVENADALSAMIKKAQDADEANKTELQKLQDKAALADKAVADQKAAHDSQVAELEKLLVDTEIKIAASKPIKDKDGKVTRAAFRADALDDVILLISRKEITRKDGVVSGISDALDALAKAKTFLLESEPEPTAKGSPTDHKSRQPNKPKLNEDEEKPFFASL